MRWLSACSAWLAKHGSVSTRRLTNTGAWGGGGNPVTTCVYLPADVIGLGGCTCRWTGTVGKRTPPGCRTCLCPDKVWVTWVGPRVCVCVCCVVHVQKVYVSKMCDYPVLGAVNMVKRIRLFQNFYTSICHCLTQKGKASTYSSNAFSKEFLP